MDKEYRLIPISKSTLLQNAANASSEGITISTMSQPDRPLIFVNEGFQRLTGYSREEVIGKNCRFLQGPDSDPRVVTKLREAVLKLESCTVELLNYKKDGTPFWNRLSITPIKNNRDVVTHYVGIQSDITQSKETKRKLQLANKELKIFQQRLLKDLDQAKQVQQFLLPNKLPYVSNLRFAFKFIPMDEIGGDFCDVLQLKDNRYGMLIADVTGHGIPAALLTFMSATTFKNASAECQTPAETIKLTNDRLFQSMPDDAFVTMFYAIYDAETNVLTYSQGGHPEGYILRKSSREVIPLNSEGTLIGVFSNNEVSFSQNQFQMMPGDKFIIYTDAIADVIEKYAHHSKYKDLSSLLIDHADLPIDQLFDEVYKYGLSCSQLTSYPDDFTLLGMEIVT